MRRAAFLVLSVFVLVASTALSIGRPNPALAEDDGGTSADSTPMLDALSLLPLGIDAFDFTHWSALKAAHGGADVTSASPLEERQRLMLDIVRSEAMTLSPGLDLLATWSERWGWDITDLEWQASCCFSPYFTILRFREDWDPEPLMARLEADGYERRDEPHAHSFTLEEGTEAPDRDFLERVLGIEGPMGRAPAQRASIAISPDGRTVVLDGFQDAHEILMMAARADPAAIMDGPFGRIAAALGRPMAARIMDGSYGCSGTGEENAYLPDEMAPLVQAIGVLRAYQAFGIGYERSRMGEPAMGRYAFAYERAEDADADLSGRGRLIDEGYSQVHGAPYRERAFTLVEVTVDNEVLRLDVAPVNDMAQALFDVVTGRSMVFAICG